MALILSACIINYCLCKKLRETIRAFYLKSTFEPLSHSLHKSVNAVNAVDVGRNAEYSVLKSKHEFWPRLPLHLDYRSKMKKSY